MKKRKINRLILFKIKNLFCLTVFLGMVFPMMSFSAKNTKNNKEKTPTSTSSPQTAVKTENRNTAGGKKPKKRHPATNEGLVCEEDSAGFIILGGKCDPDSSCITLSHIIRHSCSEDAKELEFVYCDEKADFLYSIKIVPCPKGCERIGLTAGCIK